MHGFWVVVIRRAVHAARCLQGDGFPDAMAICDDAPTPVGRGEAYALATDDVMHFSTSGAGVSVHRMDSLDAELVRRGLEKHPAKDEVAVRDGTCLGIDLCDGSYFAPHSPRLAVFFFAVLEVLRRG